MAWFRTLVDDYITEPTDPTGLRRNTQAGLPMSWIAARTLPGVRLPDPSPRSFTTTGRRGHTKDFFCCLPAGTHTITVSVYRHDGTFVGSDTWTETIVEPTSVIPASDTYVISNSGTDNGGITGANTHTTLLSAVVASTGKTQPCLYLYRGGRRTSSIRRLSPHQQPGRDHRGYRCRRRPAHYVQSGRLSFRVRPAERRIARQRHFPEPSVSGWVEPAYGERTGNSSIRQDNHEYQSQADYVRQMSVRKLLYDHQPDREQRDTNYAFALHNCRYESGFTGFGIWMTGNAGAFWAIQGTKLYQLPAAPTGGPNGSHHYGCYRVGGARLVVKDCSEFFSGGTVTDQMLLQPTCRLFTAPGAHAIRRNTAAISGCYFDGGGTCIAIPTSSSLAPTNKNQGCQVFMTHSIFVSQTFGIQSINTSQTGIEAVNCVFLHANAKTSSLYPHGGGWKGFLVGDSGGFSGSSGRDTVSPVRFHYCNFISRMTDANLKGTPQLEQNMSQFGGQLTLANNIVSHVHTSGENTAGVTFTGDLMQMGGDDWQPIFDRVRHKATSSRPAINDTSFATAPGQLPDCRVTSAPVATGDRVLFDFYNNQRPSTTRVGAVGQLST
jgi:hypothetical protein